MVVTDFSTEASTAALDQNSSRRIRRRGPQMVYMGNEVKRTLAMKEQAALIAKLFGQTTTEEDVEDQILPKCNILDLSNELLLMLFSLVGMKMKESDDQNQCVYEMLRLKLVCRRFHDLIENSMTFLPKYHLEGIRIRPKQFNSSRNKVIVHRYGAGKFELPCVCLSIDEIPNALKNDEIRGNLLVDGVVVSDELISTLLKLNIAHVKSAVFSNIRVELNNATLMNTFLRRLCNAEWIRFFGNYSEDQLHLDMDDLSECIERGYSEENREYSADELCVLAREYKFKKELKKERSAARYQEFRRIPKEERNKRREDYRREKKRLKRKQRKLRLRNKIKNAGGS